MSLAARDSVTLDRHAVRPHGALRITAAFLALVASTGACSGPWWGPSGDVTVTWAAGRCTASFAHDGHVTQRTGWASTQPVGTLVCVFMPPAGILSVDVTVPKDQTVPQPGRYVARTWGDAAQQPPPQTVALSTRAFFPPFSYRQLQSTGGELQITRWPADGRDSSLIEASGHIRVRTGFAAP